MRKLLIIFLLISVAKAQVPKDYFGLHVLGVTETNLNNTGIPMGLPNWNPSAIRLWDTYGYSTQQAKYVGLSWKDIETSNGVFDWTLFDKVILTHKANGATSLIYVLGYIPTWAGGGVNFDSAVSNQSYLSVFLTAVANRAISLGLPIKYWEIFNEPNSGGRTSPTSGGSFKGSIDQMVAIAATVATAVHAVDPTYKTISPSCQGYGTAVNKDDTTQLNPSTLNVAPTSGLRYTNTFLARGGGTSCDIMGFHGYMCNHPPEAIDSLTTDYKKTYLAYGQSAKPIFNTESFDCSATSQTDHSIFLAKDYLLQWISGISAWYYYAWDGNSGKEWTTAGIDSVGKANQMMYNLMVGGTVSNLVIAGNVYTIDVTNCGKTFKVVWNKSGSSSYSTSYNQYTNLWGTTSGVFGSVIIGKAPIILSNSTTGKYYFSTNGDDSRTSAQAQNPLTPWKTLTKFNSFFPSLSPGDSVLFRSGDTWYGTMTASRSGSSTLPIVIGAYGTGAKPIITGMSAVNTWTNIGGNIWESAAVSGGLSTIVDVVTKDDQMLTMGRYPNDDTANDGYLTFDSYVGNYQITDAAFPTTINPIGAEVVIRSERWRRERSKITSFSLAGPTIKHDSTRTPRQAGMGYFIQNSPATWCLDRQDEWYYNPTTHKLRIYSTVSPSNLNIKIATQNTLFNGGAYSYIHIRDIDFLGSNSNTVSFGTGVKNKAISCNIKNSADRGISTAGDYFAAIQDTISYAQEYGILTDYNADFDTIRNCFFNHSCDLKGFGKDVGSVGKAMLMRGSNFYISDNVVKNSGYVGISWPNKPGIVRRNVVDTFCTSADDGGGMYTVVGKDQPLNSNVFIDSNIIIHGIGAPLGTTSPTISAAQGLYFDLYTSGHTGRGNIIAWCENGIFLNHDDKYITLTGNTVFNCNDNQYHTSLAGEGTATGLNVTDNIFFAKKTTQDLVHFNSPTSTFPSPGIFNSNKFVTPSTATPYYLQLSLPQHYNLSGWRTATGFDALSTQRTILTTDSILFLYNATQANTTTSLQGYTWSDARGATYSNFITLTPFTSVVLIRGNLLGLVPPSVSIISPSNNSSVISGSSFTISAIATDADGIISSVSFYNGATLLGTDNTSPYTYVYSNIPIGVYSFTAVATDNNNLTTTSSAISINSVNTKPVVNITSPINNTTFTAPATVIINGTASDANGSISRTDFFSDGIFIGTDNTSPYSFTWSGVPIGGKTLTIVGVDNNGDSTISSPVNISVIGANIPPTVSIISPSNNTTFTSAQSVTINVTSSDVDGTISRINFYDGTTFIGTDASTPFSMSKIFTIGTHYLYVTSKDNSGDSTTTGPITINIISSNIPPVVSITTPPNDSSYTAPANFFVNISATDVNGTISATRLYQNGILIGTDASSPYTYTLNNRPAGGYSLVAHAVDNSGDSTISAPVNLIVVTPAPPHIDTLSAVVTITSPIICSGGNASVNVTATGGTPFSDGGYARDFGIHIEAAGIKTYIVEDSIGIKDTIVISVPEPGPLSATVSADTIKINGGTVNKTVTAIGGTIPYQYKLEPSGFWQISNVFNLPAGSYVISIKDVNSCTVSISFVLVQPPVGCNCIPHRGKKTIIK